MTDPRSEQPGEGSGRPDDGQDRPSRPARPAYGEYAPEGWEWKPADAAPTSSAPGAGNGGSATSAGSAPSSGSGRIPGVPHNLGVGGAGRPAAPPAAPAAPSAPPSTGAPAQQQPGSGTGDGPAPYRATAPQPAQAPVAQPQSPQAQPRPRLADRIITIALLAFGAFGALNFASSMFAIDSQLRLTATMLGIDSLTLPDWVGVLGVVSGLAVLLLFALTLIFSIRRMRAGKLAFWAPLAAGAIALLLVIVVQSVALSGAPEIMQQLQSDPNGSLQKMLEFAQTPQ
ncbi:hypothetical protein D3248_03855 [Leucobacter zeae]|nr:hypothetical protein [Leucobacter zeae]